MNTIEKVMLICGLAIFGGVLYSLIELIYYFWKYHPKNIENYKAVFERLSQNGSKLSNLNNYEIETIRNIIEEIQMDLSSFTRELGFMAKRDAYPIQGIKSNVKTILKTEINNSSNFVKTRIILLNTLGNNLIKAINQINKKVR
jgi:molybdate-binding protein